MPTLEVNRAVVGYKMIDKQNESMYKENVSRPYRGSERSRLFMYSVNSNTYYRVYSHGCIPNDYAFFD